MRAAPPPPFSTPPLDTNSSTNPHLYSYQAPPHHEGNDIIQIDSDDNAANSDSDQDDTSHPHLHETEDEDPLLSAIDDLEGRVVTSLDDFKLHPGTKTPSPNSSNSIHDELRDLLRPVLEIAAHVGPATARSHSYTRRNGVEDTVDEVYSRLNSDLILPVMLESAQSDAIPAKRAAALQFFHVLYRECLSAGSYLDSGRGANVGPYGPGGGDQDSSKSNKPNNPSSSSSSSTLKRHAMKRSLRCGELLRYWVEASTSCVRAGTFINSKGAVGSRAVISASGAIRPSLRHVSEKIGVADDAGALRLFGPVVKMISGVLKRLFLGGKDGEGDENVKEVDSLRSACVKFLEIVVMCLSTKVQPGAPMGAAVRRKNQNTDDFSLEDLPIGHPIITREALEEIGEYAFTTLRGLVLVGGQVKIDTNLLPESFESGGMGSSPLSQIVDIVKPAALAYLEIESSAATAPDNIGLIINRSNLELDFTLSQKSYALCINAISMLATNRPVFFRDSSLCIARRTLDPPKPIPNILPSYASKSVLSALLASSLTLLRNTLSLTTSSHTPLHHALSDSSMSIQADKALAASRQQAALKTAGRAARNRAAIFYEWDASEVDRRLAKRQRDTNDALAEMRAAKRQRGLGRGIQLPKSMVDACELVLLNLGHLPAVRPGGKDGGSLKGGENERKRPVTLDFVVDAIMTNGASLAADENQWYSRDGGAAWRVEDLQARDDVEGEGFRFSLDPKTLRVVQSATTPTSPSSKEDDKKKKNKKADESRKMFDEQCRAASSDAFGRIVARSRTFRSPALADFGNRIAARLAWTLKGVKPSPELKDAHAMATEAATLKEKEASNDYGSMSLTKFVEDYPLVSSCLALNMVSNQKPGTGSGPSAVSAQSQGTDTTPPSDSSASSSLANRVLNEAFLESRQRAKKYKYDLSLDVFVSSAVRSSEKANEKPTDTTRKKIATLAASSLQKELSIIPAVTPSSLRLTTHLCNVETITKAASSSAKKSASAIPSTNPSSSALTTTALTHAAKLSAEKRATLTLVTLRDIAFQRSNPLIRRSAIDCAVGIAAGRLAPGSASVEDKALKLVMNVLYPKSADLATKVVESAEEELERAGKFAVSFGGVGSSSEKKRAGKKKKRSEDQGEKLTEEEKEAVEKVRKPVVLFMALCVRRPEIIKTLLEIGSRKGADILAKAIKGNMQKLARSAATKYGAATIALRVSAMASQDESPLLLAFLRDLPDKKTLPSQELIDACHQIQNDRLDPTTQKKDVRYILPVLSGMKREKLIDKLANFASSTDDEVFRTALKRMSERVGRHALMFRVEPDATAAATTTGGNASGTAAASSEAALHGMTLCEEMVFLHRLDFVAVGLPQKRYLHVIRLCLDDDTVFTDRVVMSALDYMSNDFLSGEGSLPLAYMRTIILTCSKHESLHSWICHVLLPRLIEGGVHSDRRQWEGWMRCARMLENTGESGVSSLDAIRKLPEEQLGIYRSKYPEKL